MSQPASAKTEAERRTLLLHATTVALDGHAVVLRGAPGSGKSDLALRLIDRGASLVADDQTVLTRTGALLLASAPTEILGRLEARGLGIATLPTAPAATVRLVVDLVPQELVDRAPANAEETLLGVALPLLLLWPFEASAAAKVRLALAAARGEVRLDRD